jgi:hypothetical protein
MSAILDFYHHPEISSNTEVPKWMLAMGGAAISVYCQLQTRGFTRLQFTTIKLMLGHACDVLYEEEGFDPDHDVDLPNEQDYDAAEDRAARASKQP